MGKEVDPSDIGKFPVLIKKAQMEMSRSDILVCGNCNGVYHFVELFVEHKKSGCTTETALRESRETKPKVWAFLLWKASHLNGATTYSANVNSWKLYQSWIKLDEAVRETWVVAGRTIQSFARMGQGNLQEMPVKITKTVVDTQLEQSPEAKKIVVPMVKSAPRVGPILNRTILNKQAYEAKDENNAVFDAIKSPEKAKSPVKKPIARMPLAKLPPNPVLLNKHVNRTAQKTISTGDGNETEEQNIEKILAKRFNPRRREHEYLVKWENFAHEHNTWEPQSNLSACSQLLDTFEKQLARQKEMRAVKLAAEAAAAAELEAKTVQNQSGGSGSETLSPSRLLPRNTKVKAMDQVKQWCADNEEQNAANAAAAQAAAAANSTTGSVAATVTVTAAKPTKRKLDDSEYENDDSEEENNSRPPAKVIRREPPTRPAAVSGVTRVIGQPGAVRMLPVAAAKPAVTPVVVPPPKINGTSAKLAATAEQQPTDTRPHGIVKKPGGAVTTPSAPKAALQVRYIAKGDASQSGIVPTDANGAPIIKPAPIQPPRTVAAVAANAKTVQMTSTVRTISGGPPRPNFVTKQQPRPAQQQGNTTIIRGQSAGVRNPTSTVSPVPSKATMVQRSASVQQVHQRSSISPANKPVISRVVRSAPSTGSKQALQEEKLAALQRHGDLKITRKQLPISTPSPTTNTSGSIKQEYHHAVTVAAAAIPPPSPPRDLTLCPITGKVLGQAEGEPTPMASPEPESIQHVQQYGLEHNIKQEQFSMQQEHDEQEQLHLQQQQQQREQHQQQQPTAFMNENGDVQQMMMNDDGSPILVTGEDGTVYQVAGKNEQGQTILIAQGTDGEQQCVYVTSDDAVDENSGGGGGGGNDAEMLTLDTAVAEAVQQQQQQMMLTEQQQQQDDDEGQTQQQQFIIKQDVSDTDVNQPLAISTDDSQDGQITAEVVQADLPSPGGTRRVVLLLPDGSFMMTEVSDEQYQALNLVT